MDRPTARVEEVETELLELFLSLDGENDALLSAPIIYASAKEGWAVSDFNAPVASRTSMEDLFNVILETIPSPSAANRAAPFSLLVTQLESDPFMVGVCDAATYVHCAGKMLSGSHPQRHCEAWRQSQSLG